LLVNVSRGISGEAASASASGDVEGLLATAAREWSARLRA
jgi:hypothetical protein